MKTKFLKLSLLALVLFTASCSNDEELTISGEAQTVTNLAAPQIGGQGGATSGAFTKFSFSENKVVTTDNWDIAFRGTTILVNGGAKIGLTDEPERTGNGAVSVVTGTFASVTALPEDSTFKMDASGVYAIPTGSGNGWYSYNSSTHIISPIAGKVFVVKTHDGNYAKFEILSYYKDSPLEPNYMTSVGANYTFKFAYQSK